MKKRGFTLVELLAVIVILAIIALIATPIILGVIEKAKKGAAESSALGYVDAVEKQIAINLLDEDATNDIKDRAYSVEELKYLGVTVKGTVPSNGTIEIKNGEVKNYILGIDGYAVENGKATKPSNTKKYENEYDVYYNPVSGEKCSASDAISTTGQTTGCMKWYVFNDSEGSSTVNVILDHNTTARVAWNTVGQYGTNVAYADSNIKPEVDKLVSASNWKSMPRLITAEEVNKITGKTGWTNKSGWYCLESKVQDSTSSPYCNNSGSLGWLYDHTNCVEGSNDWKCTTNDTATYGYWTSTTYGNAGSGSDVWRVSRTGALSTRVANDASYGVRPVITISKSIVSKQ